MLPKISLVVTVYNRERYLEATLKSILSQTRSDFELLIWDDGSTDSSKNIARQYVQTDTRVKLIEGQHQGLNCSLKSALANTAGSYLGWVDSDDLLEPKALEETAHVLDTQPKVGLVYTDYIDIDANGKSLGYGKRCRIPYSKERLLLDFMTFQFRLIRRSVFDKVGGIDESFEYAEDYDLCLRLSEATNVHHLKKPHYFYRHHLDTISQKKQHEQICCSQAAIANALKRRGLDEKFDVKVQLIGRFSLHKKQDMLTEQ